MLQDKNKKVTQTAFLTQLYKKDPLVSNCDAYALLKKQFPNIKINQRTFTSSWKHLLRKSGVKIPLQRQITSKKQKGKTK